MPQFYEDSLNIFIKYQLAAIDTTEKGGILKNILEGIRDGTNTRLIKNNKLHCDERCFYKIIRNIDIFTSFSRDIKENYKKSFNKLNDVGYFYVYRFIEIDYSDKCKDILYPTLFSTAWSLDFTKEWADGRKGVYQKIKIGRNINFLSSSYFKNDDVTNLNEDSYLAFSSCLREQFIQNNELNEFIIDKKESFKIINQNEYEVVLPPGITKFTGKEKINGMIVHNYDFIETEYCEIEKNMYYALNYGTIL